MSITLMSLATSVKDYVEITHKFIELEPLKNYTELGALFSYLVISIGNVVKDIFSFSYLKSIWSIPIIIPDIASAMLSEISVLDGYFHNAFTFLETNVNSLNQVSSNSSLVILEKFFIGLINSFFLFLPTSTSHLITLRRFVMQGLEAGYISGLGTLAGNFLWISSIILGWRFFVIPWLSFDIFRYLLGFLLLVKYIWDSSKERRMPLENLSKWKIFLLNFLLALTEQTCIYPFISNLSFGPEASVLEGFAADNYAQFLLIHGSYLLGILIGSFSLLQFACWFWENPAFSIYMWITTKASNSGSSTLSTSSYYKILNFLFLYGTMLCALASIPYYGLDYTLTNPIGLVPQDRMLDQKKSQFDTEKLIPETAFLGVNATDKNSRIRDGVHARRERWKQRLIKYQAYDASVYDQGVYDFLTVEDLNYGFDRFWLRRKMRNHQIRFRLFPGPWMRSLKKQLNNPATLNKSDENTTKASTGPRVEFFRILFEQFYHPNFHDRFAITTKKLPPVTSSESTPNTNFNKLNGTASSLESTKINSNLVQYLPIETGSIFKNDIKQIKTGLIYEHSALRKFVRNFNTRINLKALKNPSLAVQNSNLKGTGQSSFATGNTTIYSKRWKSLLSKTKPYATKLGQGSTQLDSYLLFRNISKEILLAGKSYKLTAINSQVKSSSLKFENGRASDTNIYLNRDLNNNKLTLLRPLSFYLEKDQAFKRKLRYYGATTMRKLTVGNQAPYLKTLMKRGFYYYKPSLRYKKTMHVAAMRRGFRKKSRTQKTIVNASNLATPSSVLVGSADITTTLQNQTDGTNLNFNNRELNSLSINQTSYSVLNKRASRYRHQIYKDVLQHWYYTPFNRLALKFDIDAFINRQPKNHFLTKNEERLLHVKRSLLSQHYDTLRWYTDMQHYETMKNTIGGTKSFASRVYNQQFQGTFKKIRHLFAITPTQDTSQANNAQNATTSNLNLSILKFDQPLFNDTKLKDKNLIYLHEELLSDQPSKNNLNFNTPNSSELTNLKLDSAYVDSNVNSLTKANGDTVNLNGDFISQAQTLILNNAKNQVNSVSKYLENNPSPNDRRFSNFSENELNTQYIYSEMLVKLLKECKRQIYDQTFLKNYISHRIEKRDQRTKEHKKELNERLEKLQKWLAFYKEQSDPKQANKISEFELNNTGTITTGLQKALTDSIYINSNSTNTNLTEKTLISPLYAKKFLLKKSVNEIKNAVQLKVKSNEIPLVKRLQTLSYQEYLQTKLNVLKGSALPGEEFRVTPGTEKAISASKIKQFKKKISGILNNYLVAQKYLNVRTTKSIDWWRKKQRVNTKRKNARKIDRFKKQLAIVDSVNEQLEKQAKETNFLYRNDNLTNYLLPLDSESQAMSSQNLRKKEERTLFTTFERNASEQKRYLEPTKIWQNFFMKKFRKKMASKGRRYRSINAGRYLQATRKPRIISSDFSPLELVKVDQIVSTNGVVLSTDGAMQKAKEQLISLDNQKALKENISLSLLTKSNLKKIPMNKRSKHTWKKFKRFKFNSTQNKYKKRRIQTRGKFRVMNKKLKKLKATHVLRLWWWNSFLPRYFNNLTTKTISTDSASSFKPLSRWNGNILDNSREKLTLSQSNSTPIMVNSSSVVATNSFDKNSDKSLKTTTDFSTNNLPFYAGWDESLRKFVITNRLLTRRDSGISTYFNSVANTTLTQKYTNAPLQGLNEGTFLYSQTDMPFNAYDIDQFIATNQSFYAPLGWRRFEFRHSLLKSWYSLINIKQGQSNNTEAKEIDKHSLVLSTAAIKNSLQKTVSSNRPMSARQDYSFDKLNKKENSLASNFKNKYKSAMARRVKKRYKLLKQTPSQLMYNPTGPLLMEVLPSHYISIFDQQYRFPRNRYLKRNLLKSQMLDKKTTLLSMLDATKTSTATKEFTLRKRVKPRRKYHRKRFVKKEGLIFPRRTKFVTDTINGQVDNRYRPTSRSTNKRSATERAKTQTNKRLKTNPQRLRQLHRREFQQILKPTQRYQPRNGGFTWPGDYLRLESIEMPKLKLIPLSENLLTDKTNTSERKSTGSTTKQKIAVPPVGVMPRRYLIEKHNINVLKKKLEKAYLSHKLPDVLQSYKFLIKNKS